MSGGRYEELRRLREVVVRLRADPEHCREMQNLPPLTPKQRYVIAWAFRSDVRNDVAA